MYEADSEPMKHLRASAEAIDATESWQFLGGRCYKYEDKFEVSTVSRGPTHQINASNFGEVADNVTVDTNPEDDNFRKIHFVQFIGNLIGLQQFTQVLAEQLDGSTEGRINVIQEAGGSLLMLKVFFGGAHTET